MEGVAMVHKKQYQMKALWKSRITLIFWKEPMDEITPPGPVVLRNITPKNLQLLDDVAAGRT